MNLRLWVFICRLILLTLMVKHLKGLMWLIVYQLFQISTLRVVLDGSIWQVSYPPLKSEQIKYAFIQLSDQKGVFEITAFSEVLSVSQDLLKAGTAVLIRCDARLEEGGARLLANRIQLLDTAVEKKAKGISIYLNNMEVIAPLAKILSENGVGGGKVKIIAQTKIHEIDVVLPDSYLINAKVRSAVRSLPGIIDIIDI